MSEGAAIRLAVNNDEGPPFDGDKWIELVSVGDVFVIEDRKNNSIILEYELLARSAKGYVKVINRVNNLVTWYNPHRICFMYKLIDILEE